MQKLRALSFALLTRPNLLIPLTVLAYGLGYLWFGEIITVNQGFGWDGRGYRTMVMRFTTLVVKRAFNTYNVQRILPSVVIHYSLSLFHVPLSDSNILLWFRILDLALLVLAAYVYLLIARQLDFNTTSKWLGFAGLFINYANAKHYFYQPVLTDQSAFVIGLLMLYFYLANHQLGLVLMTVAGSFTWPLLRVYGLLLFLFPNGEKRFEIRNRLSYWLSALVAFALLLLIIWAHFVEKLTLGSGAATVVDSVVYLSILGSVAYIFFGLKSALGEIGIPDVRTMIGSTSMGRVIVALLIFLSTQEVAGLLASHQSRVTLPGYFQAVAIGSIVKPVAFLVAHVVYFGPIVLLTAILWKPFIRTICRYGPGLSLLVLGNFVLSIVTESRQLIAFLPFMVVFTVKAAEEIKWEPFFYWFFGIASFLFSKIWFPMNRVPLEGNDFLLFPMQFLFMNYGPWMSDQMYAVQGLFVLIAFIVLLLLCKKSEAPADASVCENLDHTGYL